MILEDTAYSCYCAGAWERWKDQVIPMITRYQSEMKGLGKKTMTGHTSLNGDVTLTTYNDGTRVFVNYSARDFEADGVTVPARDYVVKGGSGQ